MQVLSCGYQNAGENWLLANSGKTSVMFHDLAQKKERRVLGGHLKADRVQMLIVVHNAQTCLGQQKNCSGMSFGHGCYFVSTVGG